MMKTCQFAIVAAQPHAIRANLQGFLQMTFKSGDLVVLKSGGPTMTVDTVNTDIFDDNKVTGVLCVWFVGNKFERARFDHRAIEPAELSGRSPGNPETHSEEAAGNYKVVLDEMVSAMNVPAETGDDAPGPCDKSGAPAVTMAVAKRKRGARTAHKVIGPH
jgi:uncharacterized protein YodC (DUF2158 family)